MGDGVLGIVSLLCQHQYMWSNYALHQPANFGVKTATLGWFVSFCWVLNEFSIQTQFVHQPENWSLQLKIWNCSGIKGNIRYFENMHRYMDMYASLCIVYSSALGESTGRLFLTLCDVEKSLKISPLSFLNF